jgi:hypothetical protein
VTLSSGFFNSVGSDRLYTAEDFASYLNGIITDGCIPNQTGLKVTQGVQGSLGSSPPSVVIAPGKAYIKGMWLNNTENLTFNLGTTQQVINFMKHLVYLKCDTDGEREITIECYTALNPVIPADTSTISYMPLAMIEDQKNVQPANAHITSLRPYAGVSGTGITTQSLVDECVTTAKIDDLAVTTAKIANEAVTVGKLDTNMFAGITPLTSQIPLGSSTVNLSSTVWTTVSSEVFLIDFTSPVDAYAIFNYNIGVKTASANTLYIYLSLFDIFSDGLVGPTFYAEGIGTTVSTCGKSNTFSFPLVVTANEHYSWGLKAKNIDIQSRWGYMYISGHTMLVPR